MKQSTLSTHQYRIAYTEDGDRNGFPVIVHHGLIASIRDHELFKTLIQSGARLISIARPGYGESSPYILSNIGEWASLVSAVIDELQLNQFDILGMSSGAPYSYAIANRFRQRVRGIYIFSGIPALYDKNIQSHWPFPIAENANIEQMEALAHDLFFSHLSDNEREKNDIQDSMSNNCFGIAQDLILRSRDWGFLLSDIKPTVYMQHSSRDTNIPLITAQLTVEMLPHHEFRIKESDEHFSPQLLDDFIKTVMLRNSESEKTIIHK